MPRLDLQYRNRDIHHMLSTVRTQARILEDELNFLEIRTGMQPGDDVFQDKEVRDRMTNISLLAQNLNGEITLLWKRTR